MTAQDDYDMPPRTRLRSRPRRSPAAALPYPGSGGRLPPRGAASNTAQLCDGIEALLAASSGGLREPLLYRIFTASAHLLDGDVNQRGRRSETLAAVLRRLAKEGRAVVLDPEDRRWGTPAHALVEAGLSRSLAEVAP